jgi:nicotinamidase-related amidase
MEQVRDKTFLSTPTEELDPSRAALLMYDPLTSVVRDYGRDAIEATTPGLWDRWERLLRASRQADVPVIYTQRYYDWDKMSGPWLRHLAASRTLDAVRALPFVSGGSATVDADDFLPALRPQTDETVVLKPYYDSFSDTELADVLRRRGIETIVISGLTTESGIWATARRAPAEGFYAVIVGDCVASARKQFHTDALRELGNRFDVLRADDVIALWTKGKEQG